jgi:flagellar motor switch protein FliM
MTAPAAGETVSQSEIERLLAQMGDADVAATETGPPAHAPAQRHEFPRLSSFSSGELRKLRVRQEDFITSLAGKLSLHLGLEVGLELARLETVSFQRFTQTLAHPTHLTLLRLEPLGGTCLLEIPPHLASCIVDRELGGPGVGPEESRELGKMEARLLVRVIELMVGEWCGIWSDLRDLRPVLLKHENSAQGLQTCAPETTMLILGVTTRIGQVAEQIQFAFPHFTLEPLVAQLNPAAGNDAPPVAAPAPVKLKWNRLLEEIEISVSAGLPVLPLTARRLAEMKPGEIIPLPAALTGQVRVCLAATPRFVGTLGVSNGRWAVKISEILQG